MVLSITACTTENVVQEQEEYITIGFIGPLTGEIANWGISSQRGIEIAVNEIQEIDGKKIKIIYEDDMCEAKNTITSLNKLTNIDNVDIIIGPICSGATLAAAPVAEQNKKLLFSPVATTPAITDAGDYIFRNSISDAFQGIFIADYTIEKIDAKKVGVLYASNDFGQAIYETFSQEFKKKGGYIIQADMYDFPNEKDFRTDLIKMRDANIEALVLFNYGDEGGLIAKQARELGLDVQIVGCDMLGSDDIVEIAGGAIEGAIFSWPALDEEDPKVKAFMLIFENIYGEKPAVPTAAANSYDVVYILKEAFETAGTDVDAVKDYLYTIQNYEGVGGLTSFDHNGDVSKPLSMNKIKDGQFLPVD